MFVQQKHLKMPQSFPKSVFLVIARMTTNLDQIITMLTQLFWEAGMLTVLDHYCSNVLHNPLLDSGDVDKI